MKLYSLHRTHSAGESAGHEFFASKRDADKAAAEWRRQGSELEEHAAEVQPITVEPTRQGILRALNRYASHTDNG